MTRLAFAQSLGGIGDDLITRVQDTDRLTAYRKATVKTRRRRRGILAASLALVLVCSILVQIDLNYFVASCGGSSGTIEEGIYYYRDINRGLYAYDPATGESDLVLGELFRDLDDVHVSPYGIYYTSRNGLTLKFRDRKTGKTRTLYTASSKDWTHARIESVSLSSIIYRLYNKEERHSTTLSLCPLTGSVQETLADRIPYDAEWYHFISLGERRLTWVHTKSGEGLPDSGITVGSYLAEEGEPLLIDGHYCSPAFGEDGSYIGINLLVSYRIDGHTNSYALLTPGGETILVEENFQVFAGAGDYLYGFPADDTLRNTLYAYRISTGETAPLIPGFKMYSVVTDGIYMYAYGPWSRTQDVYRLDYDPTGRLVGVTSVGTVGEDH